MHVHVLSHLSCVRLYVTLWTAAHQAPLSVRFSRWKYWSGKKKILEWLALPPPGDLPDPSQTWVSCTAGRFFNADLPGKTHTQLYSFIVIHTQRLVLKILKLTRKKNQLYWMYSWERGGKRGENRKKTKREKKGGSREGRK